MNSSFFRCSRYLYAVLLWGILLLSFVVRLILILFGLKRGSSFFNF